MIGWDIRGTRLPCRCGHERPYGTGLPSGDSTEADCSGDDEAQHLQVAVDAPGARGTVSTVDVGESGGVLPDRRPPGRRGERSAGVRRRLYEGGRAGGVAAAAGGGVDDDAAVELSAWSCSFTSSPSSSGGVGGWNDGNDIGEGRRRRLVSVRSG